MRRSLAVRFIAPATAAVLVVFAAVMVLAWSYIGRTTRAQADQGCCAFAQHITDVLAASERLARSCRGGDERSGIASGAAGSRRSARRSLWPPDRCQTFDSAGISQVGRFDLGRSRERVEPAATRHVVRQARQRLQSASARTCGRLTGRGRFGHTARHQGSGLCGHPEGRAVQRCGRHPPGAPYVTVYEPMRDRAGATIGVWYVGIPVATQSQLKQTVSTMQGARNRLRRHVRRQGRTCASARPTSMPRR